MSLNRRSKISLKEYLSNEINVRIWREIEKTPTWKTLFKQKPFFDQLHKEFDFFTEHAHSYSEITKHFTKFNIKADKQKKYVFLFFLLVFIEHHYYEDDLVRGVAQESYQFIKELCQKLLEEFHAPKKENGTNSTGSIAKNTEVGEDLNEQKRHTVTIAIFEKQNQLKDTFQTLKILSKEDIESGAYPNLTEGQEIKINPAIPRDPKEAYQLFKDYYAAFQCETHKSLFFDAYRSFENKNAVNAEIKIIEDFISSTEAITYKDACNNLNNIDRRYEYKRLIGGFYNDYLMTWEQQNLNSNAASVYGEYILFYNYLKDIIAPHDSNINKIPFIGSLLNNLNLNETILDYYYRLVHQPNNRHEVNEHYLGKLNRYNSPYELSIYGAFVNMKDWEFLQLKIDNKYPPFGNVTEGEWEKAKQEYARNFKNGYYNFEKDIVDISPFQDDLNRAQIIFDFAKGRMFSSSGFPESVGENAHIFDGWEDAGKEGGYIYRAWYLILQNHYTFSPFFENWKASKKAKKIETPFNNLAINNVKVKDIVYEKFAEIFVNENWDKYITAFENTVPVLLTKEREFVGQAKKHKGVICCWIKHLQTKSIIKLNVNRSQLAKVLNNEIKGLNLGKDGKTFDNISNEYDNNFKLQLENLIK